MQEIMSRRNFGFDKDIEACVSAFSVFFFIVSNRPISHVFVLQFDMFNLKLMHLERCKYVTANDFFSINYSSMFGVSYVCFISVFLRAKSERFFQIIAAAVMNLLVIFQFRQWADNRKDD